MIISGMLPEFIDNMIEQINEDRLWQLYLATALIEERSFTDWKAAAISGESEKNDAGERDSMAEEPTPEEAVARAEGILAGFRPF